MNKKTMYEDYYDLRAPPFELDPDPRFFFSSRQHSRALISLEHDYMLGRGFRVITGEAGTGKTTLLKHMLSRLEDSNALALKLTTAEAQPGDILHRVAAQLGLQTGEMGIFGVVAELGNFLRDCHGAQRRVLLFIDEAEALPDPALEALCHLAKLDVDQSAFFEIFLLGREEFRQDLVSDRFPAVRQRVVSSYELEPLDTDDTRGYIEHRLRHAGWQGDPSFSVKSFERIYEQTGGVPRIVNLFCDGLLQQACLEEIRHVNVAVVLQVAMDMRLKGLLSGEAVPDPAVAEPPRPAVESGPPPEPPPEPPLELPPEPPPEPYEPGEGIAAGPAYGPVERAPRSHGRALRFAMVLLLAAGVLGGVLSFSGELDEAGPGDAQPAERLAAIPESEPASLDDAVEEQAAQAPSDPSGAAGTIETAALPNEPAAGARPGRPGRIDVAAAPAGVEPKPSLLASGHLDPAAEEKSTATSEIITNRFLNSPGLKLPNPEAARPQEIAQAAPKASDRQPPAALAVVELVLTRNVVDREPVDSAVSFSPGDGRAFAFARIANPGEPSGVSFVWTYGGAVRATIDQEIGTASNWRTWSSVKLLPGAWRVQVVAGDDVVLAERAFVVE